jgi:hypothetical protein
VRRAKAKRGVILKGWGPSEAPAFCVLYGIDPLKSRLVRAGKFLFLEMAENEGEEAER